MSTNPGHNNQYLNGSGSPGFAPLPSPTKSNQKKDLTHLVGRALVPFFTDAGAENITHEVEKQRDFGTGGVAIPVREWSNGVWLPPKAQQQTVPSGSPNMSPQRPRPSPQRSNSRGQRSAKPAVPPEIQVDKPKKKKNNTGPGKKVKHGPTPANTPNVSNNGNNTSSERAHTRSASLTGPGPSANTSSTKFSSFSVSPSPHKVPLPDFIKRDSTPSASVSTGGKERSSSITLSSYDSPTLSPAFSGSAGSTPVASPASASTGSFELDKMNRSRSLGSSGFSATSITTSGASTPTLLHEPSSSSDQPTSPALVVHEPKPGLMFIKHASKPSTSVSEKSASKSKSEGGSAIVRSPLLPSALAELQGGQSSHSSPGLSAKPLSLNQDIPPVSTLSNNNTPSQQPLAPAVAALLASTSVSVSVSPSSQSQAPSLTTTTSTSQASSTNVPPLLLVRNGLGSQPSSSVSTNPTAVSSTSVNMNSDLSTSSVFPPSATANNSSSTIIMQAQQQQQQPQQQLRPIQQHQMLFGNQQQQQVQPQKVLSMPVPTGFMTVMTPNGPAQIPMPIPMASPRMVSPQFTQQVPQSQFPMQSQVPQPSPTAQSVHSIPPWMMVGAQPNVAPHAVHQQRLGLAMTPMNPMQINMGMMPQQMQPMVMQGFQPQPQFQGMMHHPQMMVPPQQHLMMRPGPQFQAGPQVQQQSQPQLSSHQGSGIEGQPNSTPSTAYVPLRVPQDTQSQQQQQPTQQQSQPSSGDPSINRQLSLQLKSMLAIGNAP